MDSNGSRSELRWIWYEKKLNYIVLHESDIAYRHWYEYFRDLSLTHLNMKCQLIVKTNSIDKTNYMHNANIEVWPDSDVLVRKSHLIIHWIEGKMSNRFNHQNNFDFMFFCFMGVYKCCSYVKLLLHYLWRWHLIKIWRNERACCRTSVWMLD